MSFVNNYIQKYRILKLKIEKNCSKIHAMFEIFKYISFQSIPGMFFLLVCERALFRLNFNLTPAAFRTISDGNFRRRNEGKLFVFPSKPVFFFLFVMIGEHSEICSLRMVEEILLRRKEKHKQINFLSFIFDRESHEVLDHLQK